jgi:transposase-like protein
MRLFRITKELATEEECEKYLEKVRWPDGVACPRCGVSTVSRIDSVKKFECSQCRYQFSAKAGTVFHKTYIPLTKWFIALYLICSTKGTTVSQIGKDLGLPYKTAWHMSAKIKKTMKNRDFSKLCGLVEFKQVQRRR